MQLMYTEMNKYRKKVCKQYVWIQYIIPLRFFFTSCLEYILLLSMM